MAEEPSDDTVYKEERQIRIIRLYIFKNSRRIVTNGGLEKIDNIALGLFKDGYTDIIVNRRMYEFIGESRDNLIPETSERGDCLFYRVENI